jgi:hypothetical protein
VYKAGILEEGQFMYSDHGCRCERKSLSFRWIESGRGTFKIYVYQCHKCGASSPPVSAKKLSYQQRFSEDVKEFDEELRKRWMDGQDARIQTEIAEREAERERLRMERKEFYNDYIKNDPRWRALSNKAIERAGGVCEGCGNRPATQAHHLTYEHLGNEFLWELRAVCRQCHERVHNIPNGTNGFVIRSR